MMIESVKTEKFDGNNKKTKNLQMCGREQKNKKDQTLLLVYHAQSHSH